MVVEVVNMALQSPRFLNDSYLVYVNPSTKLVRLKILRVSLSNSFIGQSFYQLEHQCPAADRNELSTELFERVVHRLRYVGRYFMD